MNWFTDNRRYDDYDDFDWSGKVNLLDNKNKYMNKKLVSAVVSAVVVSVLSYVASLTNVWVVDWHTVVNVAVLTFATSVLKAFGTSEEGNFFGVVSVK